MDPSYDTLRERVISLEKKLKKHGTNIDEDKIQKIRNKICEKIGVDYIQALLKKLTQYLKADMVFAGYTTGADSSRVKTVACMLDGTLIRNFEYELTGTPCHKVLNKNRLSYFKDIQVNFQSDEALKKRNFNEYIAVPLVNSRNKPIGILTTIYRRKIKNEEFHTKLLKTMANRTSIELDRYLLIADALEKQEQLERISKMSSDYIYKGIFDNNNKIKINWVSGAFTEITGYTLNEFNDLTEKWTDLINPIDLQQMSRFHKNDSEDKQRLILNYNIITKKGEKKWCSDQVMPVIDENTGKINGIWGSVKDITNEKHSRYALVESEENFSNFYQSLPDITLVLNRDSKIVHANRSATRILGYPEKKLLNKSIIDIIPENEKDKFLDIVSKITDGGKQEFYLSFKSGSGSLISVEGTMTTGKWNGVDVIYGIYKDITQIKLSEEKFSKVFDHNSALMSLIDLTTLKIADINNSLIKVLGFKNKSEIIGKTPIDLGILTDKKLFAKTVKEIRENGKTSINEVQFLDKKGNPHQFLRSADIIEFQNRNFILVTLIDITEKKRIENELKKTQNQIANIHKAIGLQTGVEYFREAIKILTRTVGCEFALIGRLSEDRKKITTIALSKRGKVYSNITYDLSGTPSSEVIKGKSILIGDHVSENYPNESQKILKGITIKGYAGTPLISSDGKTIGIIAALFSDPIENKDMVRQIFEIFSGRTSAELERHISYQALLESEEKFRTYVESAPLGVAITNRDAQIEYMNPVLCRELGYELSEIINQPISRITVLRRRNSKSNFIPRLNKNGIVLNEENILRRKNGEMVSMSYDGIRIPGNKYLSYMRDITKQKRDEAEIRKLLTAVEQSSSSVVITNAKGSIEYVNNNFLKVTGYQYHEVIGRNPRILKTDFHNKKFYKDLWRTITSGENWTGEFLNRKKNGELFWEKANITPVKDMEGRIINYIAIKEDITELKHYQEDLVTVFNHTPIGIYLIDETYIIKRANDPEDLNKRRISDTFNFKKGEEIRCHRLKSKKRKCSTDNKCPNCQIRDIIRNAIHEGKSGKDIILRFPGKNGSGVDDYYSVSVIPVRRYEKKQALLLISDISSRIIAEKNLQNSEEKFRLAFKSSPNAIALLSNEDMSFLEVNEAFLKLSGYSEKEILGKTSYNLGINIDREQAKYLTDKIKEKKEIIDEPVQFRTKTGSIIETMFSARTFAINNQEYILTISRDVTEINSINKALRESEERYRALVDSFPDLIIVQDMQGKVLYTNPALEEKEGISQEEIGSGMLHPEDRDYVLGKIYDLINSKDLRSTGLIENRVLRNDQVYWRSGIVCKIVYEGKPALLTVSRDITDRKNVEQDLIREKRFVDNMINTLPSVFYLFEVSDTIKLVRWNKQLENILGIFPENLIYKSPFDFLEEFEQEAVDETMDRLMNGKTVSFEANIKTAQGNSIPFYLTSKQFSVSEKIYFLGIGIDITEQKKAENALKESEYNLQRAQEVAHIGNWHLNFETGEMLCSSEIYQIYELPYNSRITNSEIRDFVYKEDIEFVNNEWKKALSDPDHMFDIEYRIKCIETIKWVREVVDINFSDKQEPIFAIGITYDVTSRKKAEERLVRSEEQFSKAFDLSPDMIVLIEEGTNNITEVNKGYLENLGLKKSEIIGKSIFDITSGPNLEKWEQFRKIYDADTGHISGETNMIDKNGKNLICEFSATRLKINDRDHLMVIIRDVTDKRNVQEMMRESQQKVIELNKRMADYKMMALRSVMNPHFIFNSLNSIQFYIAKNERKLAIEYLSLFSKLIRNILNSSINMHITLEKELEILTYYIELEKLRFENIFEYKINVDNNIEQEYIQIPSMILQPFIENAILHGLVNKNSQGVLKINIKEKEKGILCIIEDNGIGREAAMKLKKEQVTKHTSVGVSVTSERLGIINQTDNVTVNFDDLMDENGNPAGTKVEVYIVC